MLLYEINSSNTKNVRACISKKTEMAFKEPHLFTNKKG